MYIKLTTENIYKYLTKVQIYNINNKIEERGEIYSLIENDILGIYINKKNKMLLIGYINKPYNQLLTVIKYKYKNIDINKIKLYLFSNNKLLYFYNLEPNKCIEYGQNVIYIDDFYNVNKYKRIEFSVNKYVFNNNYKYLYNKRKLRTYIYDIILNYYYKNYKIYIIYIYTYNRTSSNKKYTLYKRFSDLIELQNILYLIII